jgi:DNA-directed RNA polymerase specialized sigma24 family protein
VHNLDHVYQSWEVTHTAESLNDLIKAVRALAYQATRDDDIAQNVSIVVMTKLDAFHPVGAGAFKRWVSTIIRRTRLGARSTGLPTEEYSDEIGYAVDDHVFFDTSMLPEPIRVVANSLLAGYSLVETAGRLGVKPATLRKRLERHRKCHVSLSPDHI